MIAARSFGISGFGCTDTSDNAKGMGQWPACGTKRWITWLLCGHSSPPVKFKASFSASLYALLVLGYSVMHQLNLRKWSCTQGHLLRERIARFGAKEWITANQDYHLDALYQYEVNGKTYTGSRVSPWIMVASHNVKSLLHRQLDGIEKTPDGAITVYFDPKNPRRSLLIKPGTLGLSIIASLSVLPVACYWFTYHG